MKMRYLLGLMCMLICNVALGQNKNYRDQGYKGSVAISDQIGIFVGVETSHGWMINNHHYLGVGAGGFVYPDGRSYPAFAEVYLDYGAYFSNKRSTPVAGIKAGYINALHFGKTINGTVSKYSFEKGITIQPLVGWSWGLESGVGLTLGLSANIVAPIGQNKGTKPLYAIPKLSFAFEF